MKRILVVMYFTVMLFIMSGCANYEKDYDKNTLIVKKNNSLVEVAVEDFKDMSVSEGDLTTYIDGEIAAYNEGYEENSVKRMAINTENMSKVKLVLSYKNMESYNGFNLLEGILDDFSNVKEEDLKGSYTSAEGEKVSFDALSDVEDTKVLVLSEKTDVVVRGDILYYNDEVKVKDGIATCSGKDNAIIIFK